MKIKKIVSEDYIQFQIPSMFIAFCKCDWKCCHDANISTTICQNEAIARMDDIETSPEEIYQFYQNCPLSKAIVLGGLEPMLQFEEVYSLIKYFRDNGCNDPFVIYTGYNKNELHWELDQLRAFRNIIVKFGRYVPGQEKHFDKVLGVELASNNQYAEVIS